MLQPLQVRGEMSLFDVVVSEPGDTFEIVRTHPSKAEARRVIDKVFSTFHESDGNFVEQFQTTGFNARLFELYLHAALGELQMTYGRPEFPDFMVEAGRTRFALEATTSNPSSSGALSAHGQQLAQLDVAARKRYVADELPVRLGSALFSKLRKRYWEHPRCQALPLVLAVEPFHDVHALELSFVGLETYLYGRTFVEPRVENGRLVARARPVSQHVVGPKTIPSGFFAQPDAEHVSAVIFSNSGTVGKFTRMGLQESGGPGIRQGHLFNPHPEAKHSTLFVEDLRQPLSRELWSDGMVILHNPHARIPLPEHCFGGLPQTWGRDTDAPLPEGWVYRSMTWPSGPIDSFEPIVVEQIATDAGRALAARSLLEIVTAEFWFADTGGNFLAVVTQDTEEPGLWRAWRLKPHEGKFYPHDSALFPDEEEAADFVKEWLVFLCCSQRQMAADWTLRIVPRIVAILANGRSAAPGGEGHNTELRTDVVVPPSGRSEPRG